MCTLYSKKNKILHLSKKSKTFCYKGNFVEISLLLYFTVFCNFKRVYIICYHQSYCGCWFCPLTQGIFWRVRFAEWYSLFLHYYDFSLIGKKEEARYNTNLMFCFVLFLVLFLLCFALLCFSNYWSSVLRFQSLVAPILFLFSIV